MAHRDCLESQQCVDMKCADPCPGACAHNSYCQVLNHMPFCACPPWFVGNPFTGCTRQLLHTQCLENDDCPSDRTCVKQKCEDPCHDVCSGKNTSCQVRNHIPYCTCKQGFFGDPLTACNLQLDTQCLENDDCPLDRTCVKQKCEDPCHNVCSGKNTSCQVRNHIPYCTCKQGFFGDPLTACKVQHVSGSWPPYPGAKKRYEVVSDQLNWYGAVIDCKNRGGRLATILSDEENEMARQKTKELDSIELYWVSGINIDKNNTWMWATTGKPFTFTDWIDDQPDNWNGKEHCLMIYKKDLGHIWNDVNCLYIIHYICEYYD
ncbi:hypothetical protein J6590_067425 [Homalodisca vitripennis]|nr:hypothetical protein J6590_096712 [Homalodisca vitripennis]KAG8335476.1 hypothetical protein J6590_067425 [Homalodisca vitripennis]